KLPSNKWKCHSKSSSNRVRSRIWNVSGRGSPAHTKDVETTCLFIAAPGEYERESERTGCNFCYNIIVGMNFLQACKILFPSLEEAKFNGVSSTPQVEKTPDSGACAPDPGSNPPDQSLHRT